MTDKPPLLQTGDRVFINAELHPALAALAEARGKRATVLFFPVSYTHLTLPTICSV